MAKKKPERKKLMDELIKYHSWFARKRDGRCITCEVRGLYNPVRFNGKGNPINHNNGHYFGGRTSRMAVMFEITNQNCQCVPCNFRHNSEREDYTEYMLKTFGQEEIDRLYQLRTQTAGFTVVDLREMLEDIKQQYKEIE